ncbi:MAG: 50S ribosomal protein L9 [Candidatus Kerfeldbacteria bacterium]|nr:50S ribosomal protein L9 [Candidatus Kerfeldbacteria bacterium]
MRVILTSDVPGTGRRGDVLAVPDGFARNYLIPGGLAQLATPAVVARQARRQKQQVLAQAKQLADRQRLAEKLSHTPITVTAAANQRGRLYGAVTAQQVMTALSRQGLAVEPDWVSFPKPIDQLGSATAVINLGRHLSVTVPVTVVTALDHA